MRFSAVRTACLLALAAPYARAEERTDTPVRIDYEAPDGCPDASEFERRVRARIVRARLAEPNEMARTFRVIVQSKPERSVARVQFVDADGAEVSRTIGADTCTEVVDAIALVTALAMEARAGAEQTAPNASEPPPLEPAPPPPARAIEPAAPPRATERELRWDAGLGLTLASGYAPSLAPGLRLFVEAAPSFWSVRLSATHSDSGKVSVEGRRARLRYWGGRLEGCPIRVALGDWLFGSPCAGIDGGALEGQGLPSEGIVATREVTEPWLAAALIARIQAEIERFLLVEAELDARFPLFRHEFVFERPVRELHQVPVVAFGAAIGVGFRFE